MACGVWLLDAGVGGWLALDQSHAETVALQGEAAAAYVSYCTSPYVVGWVGGWDQRVWGSGLQERAIATES